MTFKTGLSIQTFGKVLPSSLVRFASAIELEHIEFDLTVFHDLESVITALKANQTTVHAPYVLDYGMDLSTPESRIEQFLENVIKAKNELKTVGMIVHPPTDENGSLERFYERINNFPLPIFLENMPYQSWEEYIDFFETTRSNVNSKLGMCFDIPHSYITHGHRYLELPDRCLSLVKGHNGYIHISGANRNEDTHFPLLTEGEMPIDPVKTFLKETNFSGILTMELAPKSLLEIDKVLRSYELMLGISGKRFHKFKIRIKRPFLMRRIHQLNKENNASDLD